MSYYLNGVHTAEREDLLETVLRDEWGFDGVVMSDWIVGGIESNTDDKAHKKQSAVSSVAAGNDLIMPGSEEDYEKMLLAVQNGKLPREKLILSAKRMLKMIDHIVDP